MKVAFITTQFPPDYQFGGPVESAGGLVAGLLRAGAEVNLAATSPVSDGRVSLDWHGTPAELSRFNGRRAKSFLSHRWAFAPRFPALCLETLRNADAAYINGIGTFPNTVASYICGSRGIPFVEAVRGGFEPYRVKHHKFRKIAYFKAITLPLLSHASAVHVTAETEATACRSMGVTGKLSVIPNGIFPENYADIPDRNSLADTYPQVNNRRYVLFVSRLSWEKGLDLLGKAWPRLSGAYPDYRLLIAGEADRPSYEKVARRFFRDELERSVHFLGAVHGPMLKALYGGAEMLVLPSYSENFGNVVLEALACGTPVLTTTGTPWKLLQERNFGRWVSPAVDGIAEGLADLLGLGSTELRRMGRAGREHVLKNYSWYRIGEQMHNAFEQILA